MFTYNHYNKTLDCLIAAPLEWVITPNPYCLGFFYSLCWLFLYFGIWNFDIWIDKQMRQKNVLGDNASFLETVNYCFLLFGMNHSLWEAICGYWRTRDHIVKTESYSQQWTPTDLGTEEPWKYPLQIKFTCLKKSSCESTSRFAWLYKLNNPMRFLSQILNWDGCYMGMNK